MYLVFFICFIKKECKFIRAIEKYSDLITMAYSACKKFHYLDQLKDRHNIYFINRATKEKIHLFYVYEI